MTESLTLEGLAALVDGELHGNGQIVIRGVATLHAAGPDEVTWVNSAQRLEALAQCQAGAVLLGKDMAVPDRPAVVCADVDHAVAQLLTSFGPAPDRPATGVHPTALVDPSAEVSPEASIGPGVVIEARARIGAGSVLHACVVIGANTIIGQDCQLWPHVVVRERCVLGNRVILHSGTVIGADGFGYYLRDGRHHKIPHNGGVVIEDDVEIGACCCVDRSKTGNTRIGTGTKVDNLVQVGHNVQIGAHSLVCAQAGLAGSSRLGSYVVLGGQVGIRDNIVLHDHVMVGACSCVAGDVEASQRVTGTPATEARSFMRQIRLSRKLPDLVAKVNALLKRVEELEAAADHSSNG